MLWLPLLIQPIVWPVLAAFASSFTVLAVCYFYWKGTKS